MVGARKRRSRPAGGAGPPALPERLATDRLLLRLPGASDTAGLAAAVTASYAELNRWMAWASGPYGPAEAKAYIRKARRRVRERKSLEFLVFRDGSGEVAGGCGLVDMTWGVPRFEIGYWLRTDCVGHGYATEAARALARLAFADFGASRVELRIAGDNHRSAAVAERLGFRLEGTLRAFERDNRGGLRDIRVYALLDAAGLR